jgi:uncharacterized protein (TIRG00374 family)
VIFYAIALGLLWFTLRRVPFGEVWGTLQRLGPEQLMVLLFVNLIVMLLFSGRWWWILRFREDKVPYIWLSLYRLSGFALSYFTPGPQVGGEPLQVYLLSERHDISGTTATASVTLDKAIEWVGSFTFLTVGLLVAVQLRYVPADAGYPFLIIAAGLLLFPILLLGAVWTERKPASWLLGILPRSLMQRIPGIERAREFLTLIEQQISDFCCDRPSGLIGAMAFTLLTWVVLIAEYYLMMTFLGIHGDLLQTIAILTVARLAFLTPIPAGLGVLEAGQALAVQAMGYTAAEGIALGLLIRGRDLVFGGAGLLLAGWLLPSSQARSDLGK